MRAPFCTLIFMFLTLLSSCNSTNKPSGEFKLLPQPEIAEFYGNSKLYPDSIKFYRLANAIALPVPRDYVIGMEETVKISDPQIVFQEDNSVVMGDEGYMLDIFKDRIIIVGSKKAGRFYGYMTLLQLMDDAREQGVPLPLCHIEDTPQLFYRAIHLDMKHHMEKKEYYYELMDQLARYKINAVIAEVEDKMGYKRQPLVASADALSMKEWKKLSKYARDRFIEISPLVQGLGHASYILKHDKYRFLRDDPQSDWAFNPLLPETYEVQFDLYRDALEALPHGDYLHVGGDEVHTTGRGSGKSELELQLTWLNKVVQFAQENGRIPIFWDDMPLKYADLYSPMFNTSYSRNEVDRMWRKNEHILEDYLDMFPRNCIYMRWNYSHPQAEGNIKAMEWFTENDLEVMGATAGQTRWKLMPRNESNMENIRSFASTAIEMKELSPLEYTTEESEIADIGVDGLLLTLWDDDSPHFELYWRGIAFFAEYSWTGEQRSKEEIKAAYRHRAYGSALAGEEFAFVELLEEAVAWWDAALLKSDNRNKLRNLDDPLEAVIDLPFSGDKSDWTSSYSMKLQNAAMALRNCNRVAAILDSMKNVAVRNNYRLEVYEQVNNLVRFSGNALFDLQAYAIAEPGREEQEAITTLQEYPDKFKTLRENLEEVYGRTRILHKPEGYLLDQDHHLHLANQSINFDWQFWAEIYFLEKLESQINNLPK
ncbi:MAG: family 20 glycosylhydrolase [Bacteroidales bacterium]|nr:family 20 glycosylhydrolase [Bacteroidales bacterium]